MKQYYQAPTIKIVAFQVERGFCSSNQELHRQEILDQQLFQSNSTEASEYHIQNEGTSGWETFE